MTEKRTPRRRASGRVKTNDPDAEYGVEQMKRVNRKRKDLPYEHLTKMPIYGVDSEETDPGEILLGEIRRTAGAIEWLRDQIRTSDPAMFAKSMWLRNRASGWVSPHELNTADWSSAGALWVELYFRERQHLAAICRTALAAGIEERRVRLAERMAERVGEAIRGMLYELDQILQTGSLESLDPENDQVRAVVYRWLAGAQGAEPERAKQLSITAEPTD